MLLRVMMAFNIAIPLHPIQLAVSSIIDLSIPFAAVPQSSSAVGAAKSGDAMK